MEALVLGFQTLFSTPSVFILMVAGVFLGIVFGTIPGLTATLGVMLMIPFTFTMTPEQGLALLVGIFIGGVSGGLITAVLINIPGTPASIATTWDGYPMAKSGKPGEALALAVFASFVGGIISSAGLFTVAPLIARAALQMQSWEMFAVCLMGLVVVAAMTSEDMIKGLLGLFLGLLLATVGMDVIFGVSRWTFGNWQLMGGIEATALMMSLFAVREILDQLVGIGKAKPKMAVKKVSFLPPFREMGFGSWRAMSVSSVSGMLLGILPGVGQNIAAIVAYNQAKALSKRPDQFGTGTPEGIVSCESATSACNGGAIVPLITLGIPGDLVTAALLGGLMIHGLQPGPLLFTDHPRVVGTIMAVYFTASFVLYFMQLGLLKAFIKMIQVRLSYLFPAVLIFCVLGVFAMSNFIFDVQILIIFAIVGYILNQFKINIVTLILGFILGPLIEGHFKRAVMLAEGDLSAVLERPIAVTLLAVTVLFLFYPFAAKLLKNRLAKNSHG